MFSAISPLLSFLMKPSENPASALHPGWASVFCHGIDSAPCHAGIPYPKHPFRPLCVPPPPFNVQL
jgi:hypothetical protein